MLYMYTHGILFVKGKKHIGTGDLQWTHRHGLNSKKNVNAMPF